MDVRAPIGDDVAASRPGGWFVRVERREDARTRLYAFPHAGGGPGALGALAAELPPAIELWALNLPGRQARIAEPPRTDLEPLVREIAADLAETPCSYSLFGYCGGALLAYLAARQSGPSHLFVGSFVAPDIALVPRRLHALPSDMFWEVVLAQGGVAPELAERTDLRPLLEAAIRADFALYAGYHHRGVPLDVPVTVLYGRDDTELTTGGLLGWRRQAVSRPDLCELPAGHWLVDEDPAGVAACIAACIAARVLADGSVPPRAGRSDRRARDDEAPGDGAPDGAVRSDGAIRSVPSAESALAAIERNVRDIVGRPIGKDENFFDAGLTSPTLVALHLTSTRELADPFPVTAMFAYPNLRALRRYLAEGEPSSPADVKAVAGGDRARRAGEAWRELRKRLRSESEQP